MFLRMCQRDLLLLFYGVVPNVLCLSCSINCLLWWMELEYLLSRSCCSGVRVYQSAIMTTQNTITNNPSRVTTLSTTIETRRRIFLMITSSYQFLIIKVFFISQVIAPTIYYPPFILSPQTSPSACPSYPYSSTYPSCTATTQTVSSPLQCPYMHAASG